MDMLYYEKKPMFSLKLAKSQITAELPTFSREFPEDFPTFSRGIPERLPRGSRESMLKKTMAFRPRLKRTKISMVTNLRAEKTKARDRNAKFPAPAMAYLPGFFLRLLQQIEIYPIYR